jgi:intracellular septation protein
MKFLADLFPIILFFIAYKLEGIYVATAVAIVASLIQTGWGWWRHGKVENMHLVTLILIVVLGGATLLLQDRSFVMWKPTAVNWLFGAVFLASHFIGDKPLIARMMGHAMEAPAEIWRRLNLGWVTFFLLLGVANLWVANLYFNAEAALHAIAGTTADIAHCDLLMGQALSACETARDREADWVNFKLFGMLGLTIIFVIGQAFYLARHLNANPNEEKN